MRKYPLLGCENLMDAQSVPFGMGLGIQKTILELRTRVSEILFGLLRKNFKNCKKAATIEKNPLTLIFPEKVRVREVCTRDHGSEDRIWMSYVVAC